jgi:hypothetical protein
MHYFMPYAKSAKMGSAVAEFLTGKAGAGEAAAKIRRRKLRDIV